MESKLWLRTLLIWEKVMLKIAIVEDERECQEALIEHLRKYEKEKNETKILTSALQKEREHATFATIKSYPTGSLIFSESYRSRHSPSPGATIFHQTPTMCILRIAPEGHFCSSTRLRVQGSPFSNDSFDVLTLCQSGEKETEYLPECCIFAWRFQDILRTLQNLKETYD